MERPRLYTMTVSPPGHAARLMLERKGIDHEVVNVLPGTQPLRVRLAGFPGNTVPALQADGKRIQGSRAISRYLEDLKPEPPLFPVDPERRRAVEEAERWGDEVLQSVSRRIMRWGLATRPELRRWMAQQMGVPAPGVAAALNMPVAWGFARAVGADQEAARRDVAELGSHLDRVDALIAEGTIGGDEPNAADFQIATSVQALLGFDDLRPLIDERPAAEHARRIQPDPPGQVPPFVPAAWLR